MSQKSNLFLSSAACLCLSLFAGTQVAAQRKEIQNKRKELQEIKKQMEEKHQQLNGYAEQESQLSKELGTLNLKLQESKKKLNGMEDQSYHASAQRNLLYKKLQAIHTAAKDWKLWLSQDLRNYYQKLQNPFPYYGQEDLWSAVYMNTAILRKMQFMRGLEQDTQNTLQTREALRRLEQTLKDTQQKARQEKERQDTLYAKKQELYQSAKNQRGVIEKEMEQLRDSAQAMQNLIEKLEKAERQKISSWPKKQASRASSSAWIRQKGSLPWPVQGSVLYRFGKQRHPEFGTLILHQGIRIQTHPEAPVQAIAQGRVLFSGEFHSYGRTVILDHGENLFSIYALLDNIQTHEGDTVKPLQILGAAGSTDPWHPSVAKQPHGVLYFEIRYGGEPVDPMVWLSKR